MSRLAKVLAHAAGGVTILVLGFGVMVARLAIEGESAMTRSDAEFDKGRLRESLILARRAAALHAPLLPHVALADARLEAIATGAESTQRRDVAILAWQAIRTTEEHRRWWIGRASDRARLADDRLASLLADEERLGSIGDEQQRSRSIRADLDRGRVRRVGQDLLGALAVGSVIVGITTIGVAFGPLPRARRWTVGGAALLVVGAIGWAILLSLA